MGLTAANLQALVIASLSKAEPAALEKLQVNVPLYWSLYARKGHYPEVRYLYVRRDAIRLCMACNTQQVDYLRRTQNNSRTSIDSSQQDSLMSGASSETSSSVSDRSSSSVYDAETNSSGTGSNSSSRSSSQSSTSNSTYTDVGSGSSTQNRRMHQDTYTSEVGNVLRHQESQYNLQHIRGRDNGDGTTRGLSVFQYPAWEVDINPVDGSLLPSQTARTRTKMDTFTRSQLSEHVYAAAAGQGSIAQPFRTNTTTLTLTVVPKRTVDSEMYDRPVADAGATTPSAFSTFTANVDSTETASGASSMTAAAQSASVNTMAGAGTGASESSGSSSSEMNGSSSRTASGSGEAHRSVQGTAQMESLMERLNQRFKHLQQLWENVNTEIKKLEAQPQLVLTPYRLTQIVTQYPEGVDAVTANTYLVRAPN